MDRVFQTAFLVVGAGLIAVTGYLMYDNSYLNRLFRKSSEPQIDWSEPAKETVDKPGKKVPKKEQRLPKAESEPVAVREDPPPPLVAAPFPHGEDIPKGMDRAALLSAYGKPQLRASMIHRGNLLERFIYVDGKGGAITLALLRNAEVVSARTTLDSPARAVKLIKEESPF